MPQTSHASGKFPCMPTQFSFLGLKMVQRDWAGMSTRVHCRYPLCGRAFG